MLLFLVFIINQRGSCGTALPRDVYIRSQSFISRQTNEPVVLKGPNVVVKGPPYLPDVSGNSVCSDIVDDACTAAGNCTSCTTFNQADVDHIKSLGWNFIRLGVVWAGAQPADGDSLDPTFVKKLHAILDLTDRNGILVMLDNHGDMVGSAGCGNGLPMWVQKVAAGDLIGQPLKTGFPYNLVPQLNIKNEAGYDECGSNASAWKEFAGDPNYNLLNRCCKAMNSPNPPNLGYTEIAQRSMDYVLRPGAGRDAFVKFWTLMANEIKSHPSAFAIEPMNEPMSIHRRWMYDTWRAIGESVLDVVPDLSIAVSDTGEGVILPSWATDILGLENFDISLETERWIKSSSNVFYAWHWYGGPFKVDSSVKDVLAIQQKWDVPSFATEFMSCDVWNEASAQNISHSYWHYSAYCTTGPAFGNRKVPEDTFGACILGWAGGSTDRCA